MPVRWPLGVPEPVINRPLPRPKNMQNSIMVGREFAKSPSPRHSIPISSAAPSTSIRRGNFLLSLTMNSKNGISIVALNASIMPYCLESTPMLDI